MTKSLSVDVECDSSSDWHERSGRGSGSGVTNGASPAGETGTHVTAPFLVRPIINLMDYFRKFLSRYVFVILVKLITLKIVSKIILDETFFHVRSRAVGTNFQSIISNKMLLT